MKLKDLAAGLGVTAQRVSILIKDGMPDTSLEAAQAWRDEKAAARRRGAPKAKVPELDDGSILDKGRGREGEGANLCPNS